MLLLVIQSFIQFLFFRQETENFIKKFEKVNFKSWFSLVFSTTFIHVFKNFARKKCHLILLLLSISDTF